MTVIMGLLYGLKGDLDVLILPVDSFVDFTECSFAQNYFGVHFILVKKMTFVCP